MGVTRTDKFSDQQNSIARFAKAIGHPARVAILQELFKIEGCMCMDLTETTGLSQPTISQHLQVLKQAGLIQGEVAGTAVCYCIDGSTWKAMKNTITTLLNLDVAEVDCC